MENLLKRHFWVVNVVGLSVIAFLLAGSVNGFVGMRLAAVGRSPLNVDGIEGSESRLAARLRAARSDRGAGGDMSARSPFLIDEPMAALDEPEEPPEDDEIDAEAEVDASYEVTTLPVKLLGTMVVWPAQYSSATMEVERSDHKIVIQGFELLGGQATVQEIHRTYVVLKESNKLTIAPLWDRPKGSSSGDKTARAAPEPTAKRAARRTAKDSAKMANGVRRISDTSYMIERSMIDKKLKNLAKLGSQARVVPNYHSGRYDGFRLIGMGSGSLFRDIGFTNGDIVKVINGNRIDSPNKALALYDALKNKSRLTVQLERGGMLKTMRFIVR
jgi:general secretion pathway protein C